MTYDEYLAEEDDLQYDLRYRVISEETFERAMEQLQNTWEEEGEE